MPENKSLDPARDLIELSLLKLEVSMVVKKLRKLYLKEISFFLSNVHLFVGHSQRPPPSILFDQETVRFAAGDAARGRRVGGLSHTAQCT